MVLPEPDIEPVVSVRLPHKITSEVAKVKVPPKVVKFWSIVMPEVKVRVTVVFAVILYQCILAVGVSRVQEPARVRVEVFVEVSIVPET
jgi:hypothetical protein